MAVRTISPEQCEDRLEWLIGSAGYELDRAIRACDGSGDTVAVIEVLDAIKHAAEQCAKHLRSGPAPGP